MKANPMVFRKKARYYAVQALYEWAMSQNATSDIETHFLAQHTENSFDVSYFRELLYQIPQRVTELDAIFLPFLHRSLAEVGFVELTILRIATYELVHRLEIPFRVLLNEALDLSKTFGATDSFKFINGVLDQVAKQIRPQEQSLPR